jgi:hypothetical protein
MICDVLVRVLAFGLAGWSATALCQSLGTAITEHHEESVHRFRELMAEADRVVGALGRIADVLEQRPEQPTGWDRGDAERAQGMAGIERATRSGNWPEAEALVTAFEAKFHAESPVTALKEQIAAKRRQATHGLMVELAAARQVNDPARVLELYQEVGPVLESEERIVLERDLAGWFLSLIHRRLRTGKIQAEVVSLATQVAETFGATLEGASMRASLPTLRRSVGLCPRCAQPYPGIAEACPQCLAGGSGPSAPGASSPAVTEP